MLEKRPQLLNLSKALRDVITREYRPMSVGEVGLFTYVLKFEFFIWCNIDSYIWHFSIYVLTFVTSGLIVPDGPIFVELVLIVRIHGSSRRRNQCFA